MKTGDRVVCVKTHSQGIITKGRIYTILGVKKNSCCGHVTVDVGIKSSSPTYGCGGCSAVGINPTDRWWVSSDRFAPIVEDEFLNSDEIEKIVEERIDIKLPVEA